MSLAQLLEESPTDPRARCGVMAWLTTLSDADRQAYDELEARALGRVGGWTVAALHRRLTEEGLAVQYNAFRRHTARDCFCVPG